MGDVVQLHCITTLDIPVERVIVGATEANLSRCIIVGTTEAGELYIASSIGSTAETYARLKIASSRLERMMEAGMT